MYVFSRNNAEIKIESDDTLPSGETLILHNVIILVKLVLNKTWNHCCYNIFLEQCSYQLVKK